MLRPLLWTGLLGLVALAPAQISKQGNAYLMRTKYVKGQKLTYTVGTKANVPGMAAPITMASPLVMLVKDWKKGVSTIEVKTGPVIQNGKPQGKVDTQLIQIDSQNRVIKGKEGYEAFASFSFPAGPVKVGQTWKSKLSMATPMGGLDLDAVYKFVGVRQIAGKTVAEIASTFTGNFSGKVTGKGLTRLMVSDGSIASSQATMNIAIKMGDGPAQMVTSVSTVTRT